jgi:hypothetical protein
MALLSRLTLPLTCISGAPHPRLRAGACRYKSAESHRKASTVVSKYYSFPPTFRQSTANLFFLFFLPFSDSLFLKKGINAHVKNQRRPNSPTIAAQLSDWIAKVLPSINWDKIVAKNN